MPALNFQFQFVPKIVDGSKPHTIRRRRKYPIKPGDALKLYTGMRTKKCELIKEVECTSVVPVKILPMAGVVQLDGKLLSLKEIEWFAERDGFSTVDDFFSFFKRYRIDVLMYELEVIYWR